MFGFDSELVKKQLSTDLYKKTTDRHQCLHYFYSHPHHTKKSIIYSQTLHLSRIFSRDNKFVKRKREMTSWSLKRGYPENVIKAEMGKSLVDGREGIAKEMVSVLTYYPMLKSVGTILHKHLYLLYMGKVNPAMIVSFKSS